MLPFDEMRALPRVFCDTEYNRRAVLLFCALDTADGSRTTIDLRSPEGLEELRRYVAARPDHLWVAYAAQAECEALLRCGVDIRPMAWCCLMAEASMITGTTEAWRVHRPNLLRHLDAFGIPTAPDAKGLKAAMRDLILADREFSEAEWADVVAYCWSDIDPLPDLLDTVALVHEALKSPWRIGHGIERGQFLKASAVLVRRSRGLPIDEPWLRRIMAHRPAIRIARAEACNRHYGHELFARTRKLRLKCDDGAKVYDVGFSFNHFAFEAFIESTPAFATWERTATGMLRLDEEYLAERCHEFPELREFKRTRDTLNQLKDDRLLGLLRDGHIRPGSIPFYTVTSRSQPMVKDGFLFNAAPWLRSVIRPRPGMALISCDWGRQEVAVAVAVSGDAKLKAAYESDDIYFALGRLAGAIPPGTRYPEDKKTYEAERKTFKACQLGLGFGMGVPGLAKRLFAELANSPGGRLTREQAADKAAEVLRWHKAEFATYWSYLHERVERARLVGWTVSPDHWVYFASAATSTPKLLNFPMQSAGAGMLRKAVIMLAEETTLDVVCTLHDSIVISVPEAEAEDAIAATAAIMDRAARAIIGDTVRIEVESQVWTHEQPCRVAHGAETLAEVEKLIARIEADPLSTPTIERVPPKPKAPPKRRRPKTEEAA